MAATIEADAWASSDQTVYVYDALDGTDITSGDAFNWTDLSITSATFDTTGITGFNLHWGSNGGGSYYSSGPVVATADLASVPEPSAFATFLGMSLLGWVLFYRRR